MTFSFLPERVVFGDIRHASGAIMMFQIIMPVERTRKMRVRMMAMVLAGMLAMGAVGICAGAAENVEAAPVIREETADRAGRAVFAVLGLAFLCAGGMVALIVAKDRT